jgi:hypothetical protein
LIIIIMDEAYRYSSAPVGKAERMNGLNRSSDDSRQSSEDQPSVPSIYESSDCMTITGSSSSSGGADDEEEEDDDSGEEQQQGCCLERQIDYLRQKQRILLRASRFFAAEDAYNAAHASRDAKGPLPDAKDSVWSQAKEYLLLHGLDEEADSDDAVETPITTTDSASSTTTTHDVHRTRCQSQAARTPLIDTSIVDHISSKHYAMMVSSSLLGHGSRRPMAHG